MTPDTPPNKARPGRVDAEEAARRRKLLLDVALDEFAAHGYAGANLDRIAKRCGISKMTIYRQIGGKEELFLLTAERGAYPLKVGCQAIIDKGGEPREVVAAIVELARSSSKDQSFSVLELAIGEYRSTPRLAARLLSNTIEIYAPVVSYLRSLSGGRISQEQAQRQALILMNMALGGFLKLLGSDAPDDPAWTDDVCAIFIDGITIAD